MKPIKTLVLFMSFMALVFFTGCPQVVDPGDEETVKVAITAIALTKTTTTIELGATEQLSATLTPTTANTGTSWSSSATDVATVSSSGLVTAESEGTAIITVSSTEDANISASCTVTVSGSIEALEGFLLYNQPDVLEGTTSTLPSLVGNKVSLTNTSIGGYVNASSFTQNTILYYNTPLSGDFRIQARILISDQVDISSNRGVLLGALGQTEAGVFGDASKYAFMFKRNRGDVRSYYYKVDSRGAGSPSIAQESALDEYIYEVKRDSTGITFSVFVSKTGVLIEESLILNEALDVGIIDGKALYPAFLANGSTATISNIKIYSGTTGSETLLYSTTEVEGSAVYVDDVSISGPGVNSNDTYNYQNSLSAAQADTIQLTAEVFPSLADDTSVSWSSDLETVATVNSEGLVTIVGAGDATITVTTTDGGYSDTYALHITAEAVLVSGITITGSSSVMVGLSTPLTASIAPSDATDQNVSWSSNAEGIATVNSEGVVSGVSAGTATITASASDASGVSETFSIEVTPAVSTVFSWSAGASSVFDATTAPATVDGKTVTFRSASSPVVSETDLLLANARFNIGTHYNDSGSAGGTDLDTSSTVNVDDGEFDFSTKIATVTIGYSASSGTGVFCYVNNDTSSSDKSVLGGDSKLSVDTALAAGGGTTTFTIDPADFSTGTDSLATSFIQLRADSSSSITITSIMVSYAD